MYGTVEKDELDILWGGAEEKMGACCCYRNGGLVSSWMRDIGFLFYVGALVIK